jgi:hypothetical protein
MDWLEKISITCFAASYAVVLAFEIARLFITRLPKLRPVVRFVFAGAGLFAHTAFLAYHTNLVFDATGIWINSWFGWCLSAAWILAATYLWYSLRKSDSPIGIFLIPVILALVGLGSLLGSDTQFSVDRAQTIWSMVHGISLLLGTVIVALGFVFGLMYLLQSNRLKKKSLVGSRRFRMPSLEWLQLSAEWCLGISAALLAAGLISGLALNVNRDNVNAIPWSDPVIWSSAVLFGWLLAASLFSLFYKPARQGRKVAYLVLASFLFLILELGIVWMAGHASGERESAQVSSDRSTGSVFVVLNSKESIHVVDHRIKRWST